MGSGASVDGGPSQIVQDSPSKDDSSTQASSPSRNNSIGDHLNSRPMSCETCAVTFTFFKRKKRCQACQRFFCSSCMPKPTSPKVHRQCEKCEVLVSGHFSREDLQDWKIKDMRCFLHGRNISTSECREKHDLIELLLTRFCTRPRPSIQNQAQHQDFVRQMTAHVRDVASTDSPSHTGQNSTDRPATVGSTTATGSSTSDSTPSQGANPRLRDLLDTMERIQDILTATGNTEPTTTGDTATEEQSSPRQQAIRRTQLADIGEESDIASLTVRQLKELLVNNFVNYKGCCEKQELVERVKRLWRDHGINMQRAEELHKDDATAFSTSQSAASTDRDISGEDPAPNTYPSTSNEDQKTTTETSVETSTSSPPPSSSQPSSSSTPPPPPSLSGKHLEDNSPTGQPSSTLTPDNNPDGDNKAAVSPSTTSNGSENTQAQQQHTPQHAKQHTTTTEDLNTGVKGMAGDGPKQTSTSAAPTGTTTRQDDLCHICMDLLVDCILLECGHMVTCTQCGKRLTDCPVCRQYIVRVVRVFRS